MMLLPREIDKLYVSAAAEVARARKARGLKLNLPEAIAIIANYIVEGARDGKSVAELMSRARTVLRGKDVLPEVPPLLKMVQVEATFPDGTKLVSVHEPIRASSTTAGPGRYMLAAEPIEANRPRPLPSSACVRDSGRKMEESMRSPKRRQAIPSPGGHPTPGSSRTVSTP